MPEARDYRELTDLVQDLSRVQRKAAEQDIEYSEQLKDLVLDRAKIMRGMNDTQREFVAKVGGQLVQISKEELMIQARTLDKRIKQGMLAGRNVGLLEKESDLVSRVNRMIDMRLDNTREQAQWMDDASRSSFDIKQLDEEILNLEVEITALQQDRSGLSERAVGVNLQDLETLHQQAKVQKEIAAATQKNLEYSERGSKLFGISADQVRDKAKDIEATLTQWPLLIGAALKIAIGGFDTLRSEAQLSVGQAAAMMGTTFSGMAQSIRSGVLVGFKGAAEAAASLVNEMDQTNFVTGELIQKQIRLTNIYGLQQSESSKLLEVLE